MFERDMSLEKPPICLTRKAGNSQLFRSYSRVYILYWYIILYYIYILFILQKSGDHLRCFFVFVKYESWEIFQKEDFFRISWIRNNEPPIQSTTCLWPKNTVLEHSTTLPNHVEVHRFFEYKQHFFGRAFFSGTMVCHHIFVSLMSVRLHLHHRMVVPSTGLHHHR